MRYGEEVYGQVDKVVWEGTDEEVPYDIRVIDTDEGWFVCYRKDKDGSIETDGGVPVELKIYAKVRIVWLARFRGMHE